jgi:replicative DNA helicase
MPSQPSPESFQTFETITAARIQQISDEEECRRTGVSATGFIPTGIRKWDENGGIQRSILTLFGAATGAGKSIVKLHLATNAARNGLSVMMLDFEDPAPKTVDRALARATGLDSQDIGNGKLSDMDFLSIKAAGSDIENWGKRVRYCGESMTSEEVRTVVNSCQADLILVDYIQGIPEGKGMTMERTVAQLAWDLNRLAQVRKCAVVVFSQITADVEERGKTDFMWSQRKGQKPDVSGYRPGPGPSSLAWSSALAQRGKTLIYMWRPGQWERKHGVAGAKDDMAELIFAKSNFGREGSFPVRIDLKTASIGDWE